jgi:ATP-dependent RNA helicase RhlE
MPLQLKKINEDLQQALVENGIVEVNELQLETFSMIKSGADCLIIALESSGKTTTIVINVIQKLAGSTEEWPRALIIVENKTKVLEMVALFNLYGKNSKLEIFGVHEKGDTDYDKNTISAGVDVLIGTPHKLNDLFSTAGYNINRLRMFILDDADTILKLRHEPKISRISNSIAKTQRIILSDVLSERVEILADKILIEPFEFNSDDEDDDFDEDDEEVLE